MPLGRDYLRGVLADVRRHGSINRAAAARKQARSSLQAHYRLAKAEVGEQPLDAERRAESISAIRAEVDALKADAARVCASLVTVPTVTSRDASGYMLEINIPDLHVGKLAWSKETGHEDYDSALAERAFDAALAALLARTSAYTFDEIVLVVGNDLLHSDTKAGTTTSGTPLDVDSRYQRNFAKTRRMITRAILTALTRAPYVRVVMVSGNHDALSVWHLGDSLECLFANEPRVTIDNAPTLRKYLQWGRVMLMFTHGNTGKLRDYPLVMATEQPEMFGSSEFREAHTGDKHQVRVEEQHGVRVRILPALCPPDAWHSEHQFVGNQRSAEAFVWHREQGMVGTAIYTIPRGQAAA